MDRQAPWYHEHDVEVHREVLEIGVPCQEHFGGATDARLLARRNRHHRLSAAGSSLDLDGDDQRAAPGDDVDLAAPASASAEPEYGSP